MRHGVIRVMAPRSIMRPAPTTRPASSPFSIPPGRVRPGTLAGASATQMPSPISTTATARASALADRQHLLGEHDCRDDEHPGDAHHADGEEQHHQRPAAADAPGAVHDPHPHAPRRAAVPVVHDKAQRRAAVTQADALQRCQLVDARQRDRRAGDLRSGPVPGEEWRVEPAHEPEQPERDEPVGRPRDQVARHEQPRREAGPARRLLRDLREEQHHRRRRRQHHRRHHRDPDAEIPAERAEVGARPGVHAPHPRDDDHPGGQRHAERGP